VTRTAASAVMLRICVALGLVALIMVPTTRRASASVSFTFHRTSAINYANAYEFARNSNYPNFGDNCTNFASQVWAEGGKVPKDNNWDEFKYASGGYYYTHSWSVAANFLSFWSTDPYVLVKTITGTQMQQAFNAFAPGDAIVYDSGANSGAADWHHTAIEHHFDSTGDWEIQNTADEIVHWNTWYYTHNATQQANMRAHGWRAIVPINAVFN
jgi:hypothetical protein